MSVVYVCVQCRLHAMWCSHLSKEVVIFWGLYILLTKSILIQYKIKYVAIKRYVICKIIYYLLLC
jgi:hypothetical protein